MSITESRGTDMDQTPADRIAAHAAAAREAAASRSPAPSETERLRETLAALTPEGRLAHVTRLAIGDIHEPPGPDWADEIPHQVFVCTLRDGLVVSQGPATPEGLRDVRVHRSPWVYEVVAPPGPPALGEEYVPRPDAEETHGPFLKP